MHAGDAAPGRRAPTRAMRDVIYEMSSKRLGMTCVVDDDGRAAGIITDGDLRRLHERARRTSSTLTAGDVDDAQPDHRSRATLLAVEALNIMETHKITSIVVVDDAAARRRRRAPARSVAHGDVLTSMTRIQAGRGQGIRMHEDDVDEERRRKSSCCCSTSTAC